MKRQAFDLLKRMERSWWYRGRSDAVTSALRAAEVPQAAAMLDYGAGFGGMALLARALAQNADAYEPDKEACALLTERGYRTVFQSEDDALAEPHDLIGLFDVLEHIKEDRNFLVRAYESLPENGHLVITVPAYQALWSAHDVEHHHFRRYRIRTLEKLFSDAGFSVQYASYWNMSLLLPAAVLRLIGRSGGESLAPPRIINTLLTAILKIEAFLLRYMPLPFGLSIVLVAQKTSSRKRQKKLAVLIKYVIAGGIGALTQTGTLYLWVSVLGLRDSYLIGLVIGFVVALVITFLLQKFWTYRDADTARAPRQAALYTIVALVGLGLNALLLAVAKRIFEVGGHDFFAGWYVGIQLGIVVFVSACNFILNTFLTFREHPAQR